MLYVDVDVVLVLVVVVVVVVVVAAFVCSFTHFLVVSRPLRSLRHRTTVDSVARLGSFQSARRCASTVPVSLLR